MIADWRRRFGVPLRKGGIGMTIDERIERLAERHEALTQSVEMLTHDVEPLKTIAQQDGESIRALARVAEIHERRLSEIEGLPE